ncbi:MAG: MBL fold metallo-hydrolase [Acidobacteriota bacterium]|nr:MBL fold metallo-hydrolase [Acidobacteriota bacterium]
MKNLEMTIFGALFVLIAANPGFSQQPAAAFTAEKLADAVYIVKGGVANTGFIVGEKEVAVIDAQMTADAAARMIAEIKKVTSKPLTKIILTHSDGDHVNGLTGFPQGLEIVSHVQAKAEMVEAFKAPNAQALQPYLPTRTFTDKMNLDIAPERVQLLYFAPAHTSGDIVVFLPDRKVAFVGDLVFLGRDPLIHRQKGGNSSGLIKNLKAILDLGADKYISGHNDPLSRSDVESAMRTLQEKQDRVRSLVQAGKSLEEVKKEFGISTAPAKPGGFSFPSLVEVMYLEQTAK